MSKIAKYASRGNAMAHGWIAAQRVEGGGFARHADGVLKW